MAASQDRDEQFARSTELVRNGVAQSAAGHPADLARLLLELLDEIDRLNHTRAEQDRAQREDGDRALQAVRAQLSTALEEKQNSVLRASRFEVELIDLRNRNIELQRAAQRAFEAEGDVRAHLAQVGMAVLAAASACAIARDAAQSKAWDRWTRTQAPAKPLALFLRRRALYAPLRRAWPGRAAIIFGSGLYASTDGPGRAAIIGYCRGRGGSPHPLFDNAWYLRHSPDVAKAGILPALHYMRIGDREGRSPHPLFDVRWYRERHAQHLKGWTLTMLEHFILKGARMGMQPHPLFDTRHYAPQAPEVYNGSMNPLVHYLSLGWRQGLNPHYLFSNDWYLQKNPEVAASGEAPLLHYVLHGAREQRDPHPLFNIAFYKNQNPDTRGPDDEPLTHYLDQGWRENRNPCPAFSPRAYLETNPDVDAVGVEPLRHYLSHGAWEQRYIAPSRNPAEFAAYAAPEVLDGTTPLEAWARQGFPTVGSLHS